MALDWLDRLLRASLASGRRQALDVALLLARELFGARLALVETIGDIRRPLAGELFPPALVSSRPPLSLCSDVGLVWDSWGALPREERLAFVSCLSLLAAAWCAETPASLN